MSLQLQTIEEPRAIHEIQIITPNKKIAIHQPNQQFQRQQRQHRLRRQLQHPLPTFTVASASTSTPHRKNKAR